MLCERPSVASVDVRGGAPGTRDTDLPIVVPRDAIDAICLSGGSASACRRARRHAGCASAAARCHRQRRRADRATASVWTANGGDKRGTGRLSRDGLAARAGFPRLLAGQCGAGLGAKAGNLKGGLGTPRRSSHDRLQVGARVAGMPGLHEMATCAVWAWALEQNKEFGGLPPPAHGLSLAVSHDRADLSHDPADAARSDPRANTTIAVVATNARLDKASANRLAVMAQDGLARSIRPVHTPQDGDTVFVVATGAHDLFVDLDLGEIGTLAADCLGARCARRLPCRYARRARGCGTYSAADDLALQRRGFP